jgi:hypothetical protein
MAAVKPPPNLGPRGRRLWTETLAERDLDPAGRILLHEACRMTDRLEQMDLILRGDASTWAVISDDYAGGKRTTKVVLDDALAEARQQAATLRQLLTTLKLGSAVERPTERGSLDQLAGRRAARRAGAADQVGT